MVNPFKDRLLLWAFLLVLVVLGGLVARKFMVSIPEEPVAITPVADQEPGPVREIILYFADPVGLHLVPESREVEGCEEEQECLRAVVQELVNGPVADLAPVLPSHAVVLSVQQTQGVATVDFSRELVTGHPGGSASELLTVYGLANTLAVNFPHVRQVQVLVEGQGVETLKGHVDLRQALHADFAFGREPATEGSEPLAAPGTIEEIIEIQQEKSGL